jgi:AraC-like DNA-binding protein
MKGSVEVQQSGLREVATAGQVIVGNGFVPHTSAYLPGHEVCEAVTIILPPDCLRKWLTEFNLGELQNPVLLGRVEAPDLRTTVAKLKDELASLGPGHRLVLEGLAQQVGAEILRRWPRQLVSCHPQVCAELQLPRAEFVRAVEYMNASTKDKFKIEDLCHVVGSSASRFTRLFAASTRLRPLPFFNRMLIERAKVQLVKSEKSVKDVAYGLGFRSAAHFSALFRQIAGESPQVFRDLRAA